MSIKLSSLLKLSVAGAVMLSVGACKPADKGQGALKSEGISALNLSKSESSIFAKYFEAEPCDVAEMESLGALAGLGLGESGANGLSFDAREVSGGLVTYQGLTLRETDSVQPVFTVKTAVFHCPKMGEDDPVFDRLDLTDVFIFDQTEGVEFTATTVNIAKPTAGAARSIVESMTKADTASVGDTGFGAISMTGAKIKSNELNGTMAALSWGEIRDENGNGKADLTVADVDLTLPGKDDAQNVTVTFGGMSARNMNIGGQLDPSSSMSASGVAGTIIGNMNAFDTPYDELIIESLKVDAEGFNVDFGGIEGKTSKKGGIITTRQSLKPTQIIMKPALGETPSLKRNYEMLKSLGFETINMSGSSVTTLNKADDSIIVSDGLFVIDDALRLNFEYAAEGLSEMSRKAKMLQSAEGTPDVLAIYDALKLRNFRLTMEDNSIVSRGLKLATEMTGQSEKNIKRSLGMMVFAAAMAAENEVQAEVYSETIEAFSDFVKNGGTLTIEANPPAPFPLAPLITGKGADIDPATLGFSASQDGGAID